MDGDTLQTAAIVGTVFGSSIAAVVFGRKSKGSATEGQATVLAGSISDPKLFRQLLDALDGLKSMMRDNADQRHRDDAAMRDSLDSNTRAVRDAAEAYRNGAFDPRMLALLGQLKDK